MLRAGTLELPEFIDLTSRKLMTSAQAHVHEIFRRFELLKIGFDSLDRSKEGKVRANATPAAVMSIRLFHFAAEPAS